MNISAILSLLLLFNINLLTSFYDYKSKKLTTQIANIIEITEEKQLDISPALEKKQSTEILDLAPALEKKQNTELLDISPTLEKKQNIQVLEIASDLEKNIDKLIYNNPLNFKKSAIYETAYFSNLLSQGINLDQIFSAINFKDLVDENGNNYLHYAAALNDIRLAMFIISRYPTMALTVNNTGQTPLHIAAMYSSYGCISLLIYKTPFIINFTDKKLNTAVHYSFLQGDIESAKIFLDNPQTNINLINCEKLSIGNIAIMKHNKGLQDLIAIRLLKGLYQRGLN